MHTKSFLAVGLFAFAVLNLIGCSEPAATAVATNVADEDHDGHSLEGWWCDEHGVPEAECALCNPKLVESFKAKGDWCEKHDRPNSQCFACNPQKEAEFAALYEAKAGRKPPKPSENGG
jgi:hypothetical protein